MEIEVRLLPVTEEREFRPVGALDWPKIDLRLIAATHRDPKAEDLPLLRERRVPLLLGHFLDLGRAEGLRGSRRETMGCVP